MEVKHTDKIKVRIKSTRFNYKGKGYVAGDILEIEESAFVSYVMERIEEPAKKKKPTEKKTKVVVPTETIQVEDEALGVLKAEEIILVEEPKEEDDLTPATTEESTEGKPKTRRKRKT